MLRAALAQVARSAMSIVNRMLVAAVEASASGTGGIATNQGDDADYQPDLADTSSGSPPIDGDTAGWARAAVQRIGRALASPLVPGSPPVSIASVDPVSQLATTVGAGPQGCRDCDQ